MVKMFRGESNVKMDSEYFGVGSVMRESGSDKGYMIVGAGNEVRLMSLDTFQLFGPWIKVEDPNWISVDEAREFASQFQCSFSDYDYIARGLKELDPKSIT